MKHPAKSTKLGATRGQLALVAVLSVVLVAVVVVQLPDDTPVAKTTNRRPPARTPQQAALGESRAKNANQPTASAVHWPELTLEDVLQHDPFVTPAWAIPSIELATTPGNTFNQIDEVQLEQLQQQGASVVIITNQEKVATVGEQQIRVGDSIEGLSVIDITPQGIVLSQPNTR